MARYSQDNLSSLHNVVSLVYKSLATCGTFLRTYVTITCHIFSSFKAVQIRAHLANDKLLGLKLHNNAIPIFGKIPTKSYISDSSERS